jgi:3-deoxy-D-manno-octulosonic-acid transferase
MTGSRRSSDNYVAIMDHTLLQWINQGWAQTPLQPLFDIFFGWVSQKQAFAFPLSLIILWLLIKKYGLAGWRLWLLMLLFIGLGDALGNLIKHLTLQARPCAEFPDTVRLVMKPFSVGCNFNPHGMPSNHALDYFIMASFLGVAVRSWRWGIGFGVISLMVAISRIYLGVHYPSQVLAGVLIGISFGSLAAFMVTTLPFFSRWLDLKYRSDTRGLNARLIYSTMFYLTVPLILWRLLWRGRLNHAYWHRWPERFGWFKTPFLNKPIWIHAVSVGEVQAALPLIRQLHQRYPDHSIVVTTTTPTGSARVRSELGKSVFHVYAPYDFPGVVARFLKRVKPVFALFMETELWPNQFYQCRQRNIPVVVANARLSQHSMEGFRRLQSLTQPTLQQVSLIAAQNQQDADNFQTLGMQPDKIQITGSIKFDLQLADDLYQQGDELRKQLFGNANRQRPVWIAASTHEGEEEQVLTAFAQLRKTIPDCLLLLVPRHPERSSAVMALCEKAGLNVVRRSEHKACEANTQVFIGDTLGELMVFYVVADVAFVGGSLVSKGGQNILEPAELSKAVITGPYTYNFAEISRVMQEAGALRRVSDANELATTVIELLENPQVRQQMGERGKEQVEKNRGSLNRLLELVTPLIPD